MGALWHRAINLGVTEDLSSIDARYVVTANGLCILVAVHIYDLWGDSVNTASRMESLGTPGSIQVTQDTYEKLKHRYQLEPRGEVDVQGKGRLTTWWLVRSRYGHSGGPTVAPARSWMLCCAGVLGLGVRMLAVLDG